MRGSGIAPGGVRLRLVLGAALLIFASALLLALPRSAPAAPLLGFNENAPLYYGNQHIDAGRVAGTAKPTGAGVIRFVLAWKDVEARPQKFDFSRYDRVVNALRSRGMRPLISIQDAPQWAEHGLCSGRDRACPPGPNYLPHWQRFAGQVALRYGNAAVAIEIWNGPNWAGHWNMLGGANPEYYARMFTLAARRIHEVNPTVPVLVGGLDDAQDRPLRGDMSAERFLHRFYDNIAPGTMRPRDGVAIRAFLEGPDVNGLKGNLGSYIGRIRAVLRQRDAGRSIWMTEAGLTTSGPRGNKPENQRKGIESLLDATRKMDDVAAVIVHSLFEHPGHPTPDERGWGVVGAAPGFKPKPAYCGMVARLSGPLTQVGCRKEPGFRVLGKQRNKRKGIVRLTVAVPGPGTVELRRTAKVRGAKAATDSAGKLQLKVAARPKLRKRATRRARAGKRTIKAVRARVAFRPDYLGPVKRSKPVKLVTAPKKKRSKRRG